MTLEELQEQVLKMQEEMQTLKTEKEQIEQEKAQAIQRQKELEEHNQKLFLRVTSKVDNIEKEENEEEKEIKEFIGEKLYNSLNKKELNLLNEIMKGEDE